MNIDPKSETIVERAIKEFNPKGFVLMVSGGNDSVTNAHVTASILNKKGIQFTVYHGDTTIGIPETQAHVKSVCEKYGWHLEIRRPHGMTYEDMILKWGFPGPTKRSHQIMYRMLKERALNRFITYTMKSSPLKRENILLFSGVRKDESKIRMGYTDEITKQRSKIWTNTIFHWTESDCDAYMKEQGIPRNPVKDKICISGECLCGAFAGKEELAEIKFNYPAVYERIVDLHKRASEKGFPWGWASGPSEWRKEMKLKNQLSFMCAGCETRKDFTNEPQLV